MFLNPAFLFAALVAVVPLILHMMQRRRIVRMPFSTIRFLKLARTRSSNRLRMENLLLWLLWTLTVLLIAASFAMPMFRTSLFGRFLGGGHRDVAIVLDHSFSMRYETRGGTAWKQALEAAAGVVAGLKDGDQVCVFLAAEIPIPVVELLNADRDFVLKRIRGLEPGTTSSDLAAACGAAAAALGREERHRERELHVITDGQALAWQGFPDNSDNAPVTPDQLWNPDAVGPGTAVFVMLTGVPSPANQAPLDVAIQPPLLLPDTAVRIDVRTQTCGDALPGTVSLSLGEERISGRVIGDGGMTTFRLPALAPGRHAACVETVRDSLHFDDAMHFILDVRESLRALCVGSVEDTFFLRHALSPAGGTGFFSIEQSAPAELSSQELSGFDAVFLSNALPMQGQAIAAVDRYVRNGGMVTVFPGRLAAPSDYAAWACLKGMVPSGSRPVVEPRRKRVLRWETPAHPVLAALALRPGNSPVVTIMRELHWDQLGPDVQLLAVSGENTPFLVTRREGEGHVLLFSVAADRLWSTLPLSPFFLPIVHEMVLLGAGLSGERAWAPVSRTMTLGRYLRRNVEEGALLEPERRWCGHSPYIRPRRGNSCRGHPCARYLRRSDA